MSSLVSISPVSPEETVARFVLYHRWIRTSNHTVKSDAFIPHPYQELSVTRHIGLSENEIWDLGRDVALSQEKPLLGRADIQVALIHHEGLSLSPKEPPRNHANVVGFPVEKSEQKRIALKIAAEAKLVPSPSGEGNR